MQNDRRAVGKIFTRAAIAVVIAGAFAGAAQAAPVAWTALANHLPALDGAVQRQALAAGEPVHVAMALKLQNEAALDSFVAEVSRPGSPAYGQFLTPAQVREQFAPSDAQVAAVVEHLSSAGFTHIQVAPNKLLITADGTASTVEAAFRTELAHFSVGNRDAIANTTNVQLPVALQGTVLSVLGLQNVTQMETLARRAAAVVPASAKPLAAQAAHGFDPVAFQQAYGVGNTGTAANTVVGILSEGDLTQTVADLHTFESQNGLPQIPVSIEQVGAASTDTSGIDEWDLDSQDIQAMSGGVVKQLVFYDVTSLSNADIMAGVNQAVTDDVAKIINVSLGECETSATTANFEAGTDQLFKTAVAQGQTFSVSSGDSGSHECSVLLKTRSNAKQSYPAVSPYVVAVGGTSLYTNADGSYASETAWSDGGGGPSVTETQPSWQSGIVSGTYRGVPDVALAADPNTGAIIIVSGSSTQVGGTSLAAPLFSGLYARIQTANGNTKGFPAPSFYKYVPGNPSLFHDVTSGSNGGVNPYSAAAGWDYTTGFGSPIVANLAAFVAATPAF
jgi:pseudomonalisin/xanthomonalisin